jgi:hypothetical protein
VSSFTVDCEIHSQSLFRLGGLKMHAGGGALFGPLHGEDFSRLPAARSALNHIASATVWPRFGAADCFGMAEFA